MQYTIKSNLVLKMASSEEGNENASSDFSHKLEAKTFKCCQNKQTKITVCVNCGNVFHQSCFLRNKVKFVKISDTRIMCCEKQPGNNHSDIQNLKNEVELLKKLIEEKDEKCKLLLDHITLLKQNNQLLEEKIEFTKNDSTKNHNFQQNLGRNKWATKKDQQQTKETKTGPLQKTTESKGININNLNDLENKQMLVMQNIIDLEQPKTSSQITQINVDYTKAYEIEQRKIMQDVINLAKPVADKQQVLLENKNTTEQEEKNWTNDSDIQLAKPNSVHTNSNENEWQQPKYRRINKNKISVGVPEKGSAMTRLKTVERLSWIYLSNLEKDITPEDITACLDDTYADKYVCQKLTRNYPTKVASFKLGVPTHMERQVKSLDFWIAGTIVDTYRFRGKKSDTSKEQEISVKANNPEENFQKDHQQHTQQ